MTTHDSTVLLFRNTMRISDGHLESFRDAISKAVAFAEQHGPQLMVETFLDEERMLAHSARCRATRSEGVDSLGPPPPHALRGLTARRTSRTYASPALIAASLIVAGCSAAGPARTGSAGGTEPAAAAPPVRAMANAR
ncbi:hypothetical protein [Streptomyces sp. URMC 123]|uniref:hypothetical protein n=1 Tax=Streptomyces sp. URMC 123 TaxID=3423403 RepID=UPI003F1B9200